MIIDKAAIIIQDSELLDETGRLTFSEARPWAVWRREVVDPIETLSANPLGGGCLPIDFGF